MGKNDSGSDIEFIVKPDTTEAGRQEGTTVEVGASTEKRGRGRPKKSTEEINNPTPERLLIETPKNKAKRDTKDEKALETNIQIMLSTLFGVLGSKNPIWNMTDEETKAIAEPLGRIVNRMIPAQTASKYGDYALLAGALGMTIAPRLIISREMKKNERKIAKPVTRPVEPVKSETSRNENIGNTSELKSSIFSRLPNVG